MVVNLVLILIIIIGFIVIAFRYVKDLEKNEFEGYEEEEESETDLAYLDRKWNEEFSRMQRKRLEDDNLSKKELEMQQKKLTSTREAAQLAEYGEENARRKLKNIIKDFTLDAKYDITGATIDNLIPYNNRMKLKSNDQTKTVLYLYSKVHGPDALAKVIEEFHLDKLVKNNGVWSYVVTKERMAEVYDIVMSGKSSLGKVEFTFNDKLEMLAQRIFEINHGFGVIDILVHMAIDEIDIGVSGVPMNGYSLRKKNYTYSFESTWIMYKGKNIRLECLAFETQEELIRVCDNIYKYDAPYVLSRTEGSVLSTMIDGSRILVLRPPFGDSYMFFLRKFNSAPSASPAALIKNRNNAIPICFTKWMVLGQRIMGVTGSMGTGKSTWLKSILRFIDPSLNIRFQEKTFELNARFTYPHLNAAAIQETAKRSQQEGLDLIKKMNSEVMVFGEIAEAVQTSFLIQSAHVAALFALFTHHAKTTKSLVKAMADNLLQMKLCQSEENAIQKVIEVLEIDCHLSKFKKDRHIERITEIIPLKMDVNLPSEEEENKELSTLDKTLLDMSFFFKRNLNREFFDTQDIIRLVKAENGEYEYRMVNPPSENLIKKIRDVLTEEQEEEFMKDLEMMERMSEGEDSEELREWEKYILSF